MRANYAATKPSIVATPWHGHGQPAQVYSRTAATQITIKPSATSTAVKRQSRRTASSPLPMGIRGRGAIQLTIGGAMGRARRSAPRRETMPRLFMPGVGLLADPMENENSYVHHEKNNDKGHPHPPDGL